MGTQSLGAKWTDLYFILLTMNPAATSIGDTGSWSWDGALSAGVDL